MAAPLSPALRRVLRLAGYIVLTLAVYWANDQTPPDIRLGILYIVPVLLVTWTEGLAWGLGFAVATSVGVSGGSCSHATASRRTIVATANPSPHARRKRGSSCRRKRRR